jgi:hypothetical protein
MTSENTKLINELVDKLNTACRVAADIGRDINLGQIPRICLPCKAPMCNPYGICLRCHSEHSAVIAAIENADGELRRALYRIRESDDVVTLILTGDHENIDRYQDVVRPPHAMVQHIKKLIGRVREYEVADPNYLENT